MRFSRSQIIRDNGVPKILAIDLSATPNQKIRCGPNGICFEIIGEMHFTSVIEREDTVVALYGNGRIFRSKLDDEAGTGLT